MGEQAQQTIEAIEGLVKWFDPRKGFGFIIGPEGQDIFTHYSVIQGDGFRVLKDGASVQYDAVKTDKGWKATRVTRVETVEVPGAPAKRGYTRTPRTRADGPSLEGGS
jgi:cold shock protein